MKKLLLIDGHSLLNRAFYGIPPLTNYEGLHTNAVFGFINIMLKVIEEEKADYLAVAFDLKAPTFRHLMYEGYKGTRKPMPEELHEQVPLIKEALAAMEIPVITMEGFEADDILGTLAKNSQEAGMHVSILSGDRDLLQLADENILIKIPKTIKGKTEIENYYPKDVLEKYQVTPKEFIDLKALMGDASDNIPGVPGIGEKTATSIIIRFQSIENAHAHLEEITPPKAKNNLGEFYEQAQLSKTLATIDIHVPLTYQIEDAVIGNLFTPAAYEIFNRLELKSLLRHFAAEDKKTSSPDVTVLPILDFATAEEVFSACETEGVVGVHIASQGSRIYGIALTTAKSTFYLSAMGMISEDYLLEHVKSLSRKCQVRVINLKQQMDYLGTDLDADTHDLALMGYIINPLKDTYFYDDIAKEYMEVSFPSRLELAGKSDIKTLAETKEDILMQICGYDSYVAYHGFDSIYAALHNQNMLSVYEEIELPVLYVLRSMERDGIRVNPDDLKAYSEELAGKIADIETRIYEEADCRFNLNSPKQLGEILFEKMGLPSGKKTKTGYSTSAEVLEKLAGDYPFVKDILEYRTLAKLKSTYADGLADYISEDGRIHGTFNQTIAATGRLSSTEPNLQNIPIRMEIGRKIRKVFIPKDGYTFIDADYSQIELRLLAHMSQDETLITAYNEATDIHRITASKVFHRPLEEVTSEERSSAKAVNFGIIYGISSFGLSRDLNISTKEAKKYIEDYFETYPSIKNYLDYLVAFAKEHGYAETIFGRRRPIPELASSNFMQRQFGERIAMNSPLQGTAADIIKIAMIRVYEALKKENLSSRLILQVHDELLIETAPGEEAAVKAILETQMRGAAALRVPLEIDIHQGDNWFEAK